MMIYDYMDYGDEEQDASAKHYLKKNNNPQFNIYIQENE